MVRSMVEAVLNARQRAEVNLRWPLRKLVVVSSTGATEEALRLYGEVLGDQANAVEVELVRPGETWEGVMPTIEPVMAALGPAFKRDAPKVAEAIASLDPGEARGRLEGDGLGVTLDGRELEITAEMVRFGQSLPDEIISAEYSDGVVYIDTEMNDELKAMGYARETIRRIQEMRKEMDLDVEDYISTRLVVAEGLRKLLEKELGDIEYNTRSREFSFAEPDEGYFTKSWDIAGETFLLGLRKMGD